MNWRPSRRRSRAITPCSQPRRVSTRLGFAALLTFFRHEGRFPASKHEVHAAVVAHLAGQVGVPA